MSILVGQDTRLLVQGLTGREGTFHALACRDYGTQGRRGRDAGQGRHDVTRAIPVFDTVADAVEETGAERVDDLRAAALRRRRHRGGGGRGRAR